MKKKDIWADEWISKERGVIATRQAWLAGFEFAKIKILEDSFLPSPDSKKYITDRRIDKLGEQEVENGSGSEIGEGS